MTDLLFYMFASVLVISSLMVISSNNPVHSVLFLILAFFNAAGLFLMQGAEFVALILVIVYVGAVAVLFLFVVMMLDIDFKAMRKGAWKSSIPVGLAVGGALLAQVVITILGWSGAAAPGAVSSATPAGVSNTVALGRVLYTDYIYPFQVAGLILLVAMIGAIALTLREQSRTRKQNIDAQITRKKSDVLEIRKVEKGAGIQ